MTFEDLLTEIRTAVWPAGEAVTLRPAHTGHIKSGLIDLQKAIPELQVLNTSSFSRCDRLWKDGMSVITQPNGIIQRVYTIVNDNWRDYVLYQSRSYQEVLERSKRLSNVSDTPSTEAAQGEGYFLEEAAVDSDVGRARDGWWAIDRRKIFLAPWLQSNEKLKIEWDGIKTEYEDGDILSDTIWTRDVLDALQFYVQWKHEWFFGDKREAVAAQAAYGNALADLMIEFVHRRRQKNDKTIPDAVLNLSSDELDNDDDAAEDPTADEECDDEPTLPGESPEVAVEPDEFLVGVFSGTGSPEGVLAKGVGSIYTDVTDTAHPVTWKKTSGGSTSAGWIQEIAV